MLKITKFTVLGSENNRIVDEKPFFGFALSSDKNNNFLKCAKIQVNDWVKESDNQINIQYDGELKPFNKYDVTLTAVDNFGEEATIKDSFCTAKLDEPWVGKWISDGSYIFKEAGSPKVMTFFKKIPLDKKVDRALICITALGIYKLEVNGKRVGEDYFTPGFTTYKKDLQYQVYDITDYLKEDNEIKVIVAGGWAVGDFTYGHKNRITADRQALKAEIRLEYADLTHVIGTDESWKVTTDGPFKYADFYDGEVYDARDKEVEWHNASIEKPKTEPQKLSVTYGEFVRLHEVFKPISVKDSPSGEHIYDFGQNFAGIVKLKIKNADAGQVIRVHHAEVLFKDELCLNLLRRAKCELLYTCVKGEQEYIPSFTYMGFRYVGITGIDPKDIEVEAYAIYSDVKQIGNFSCNDERLNKLQQNILWSSKSNFVEIPTDCPQRDERMGWTGDIALFANTACYNFDMEVFLRKWLRDLRSEQVRSGGFPNTAPSQSHGFPLTMPNMAIDFWGDASILVPYALYQQTGDLNILKENYEMMKKYHKACLWWANFLSLGKSRYIWKGISMFHFGDWVAPDIEKMSEWQKRHKYTATASLANTSNIMSKVAKLLNKEEDAIKFNKVYLKTCDAYESKLTDGKGKIKGKEFQTAYVLPLAFNMFKSETKPLAVNNLADLIKANDYCVGTGFPGTPYLLFSLADNGREDIAFKMLFNDKCPSWLYEVKVGGTTTWERWDALREDGSLNWTDDGTGGMISFNHYAVGAVGDFLYKRVLGVEPLEGGYKKVLIKPLLSSGLTSVQGETISPYGPIKVDWTKQEGSFNIRISIPFGSTAQLVLPNGETKEFGSGDYQESVSL